MKIIIILLSTFVFCTVFADSKHFSQNIVVEKIHVYNKSSDLLESNIS